MEKLASLAAVLVFGAATAFAGPVIAATVEITGYSYYVPYSGERSKNNVVNYAPSGITDDVSHRWRRHWVSPWRAGGAVLATIEDYSVDWYFNGAESGYTNSLAGGSISLTEHDENNNWSGDSSYWEFLGTTTGSGAGQAIDFSVTDEPGKTATNGGYNPVPWQHTNKPSLIFAYANPVYEGTVLEGWELSLTATDWFVFGFNDSGSKDKDYDDLIGLAYVRPVPLPGALPLMGTVIGGSFLLRRLRRSRRRATSAAMAA